MQHSSASTFGILDLVRDAGDVCGVPAGEHGVGQWMDLIGEVTAAMTVLAAARDAAIVRLAAIEEVVTQDGVIGEQVNGLGTVSLDAGAMVSTATGTSTRFGEDLVEQAVTRVVRVPALQEAMLSGVLDDYKARSIAAELTDVPPDLARTVVDALGPEMSAKSGPALRRRTRDILFKLAPELLKERIRKARNNVGLRRWLGEPGTDSWGAVFPSERAASTWAAIDALARQHKADGKYPTLEQARAYALLDLVDGRTTVETVLHLTVPADAVDEAARGSASDADRADGPEPGSDDGVPVDSQPPDAESELTSPQPAGCAGGIFVATSTGGGTDLTWMPLSWLGIRDAHGVVQFSDAHGGVRLCHARTGALVDPGSALATEAYRPGKALKQLVRQRDGRCRFPGCVTAARQCDLDHVVPWPAGPTDATNLICLCRRHHRVKQRHRWRVRLDANGLVEWTDPAGRRLMTEPVDHLRAGQVRVSRVEPASPEDIAELLELELIAAQFDEGEGVDAADLDATEASVADHSALEAVVRMAVAAFLNDRLRAGSQDSASSPLTMRNAWTRKRFGAHTSDLDRIPRPERQGYHSVDAGAGAEIGFAPPSAEQGGCDEPAPIFRVECRFVAGMLPGAGSLRYRASRRHRRRAAYLAAGGPPF